MEAIAKTASGRPADCIESSNAVPKVTVITGAALSGMVGTAAGPFVPKSVDFGQGIEANVSLTGRPGLTATSGPTELIAPNVPTGVLEGTGLGLRGELTQFDAPTSFDAYAPLVANFDSAVIEPIAQALLIRAAQGATIGMVLGTAATYGAIKIRELHKENAFLKANHKSLKGADTPTVSDSNASDCAKPKNSTWQRHRRKLVPLLAVTALVGCGPRALDGAADLMTPSSQAVSLLSPDITERFAAMKDARISNDIISTPLITAADELGKLMVNSDKHWTKNATSLGIALDSYIDKTGSQESTEIEGSEVSVMHIADTHCVKGFEHPFAVALEKMRPQIIVFAGDVFASAGEFPYEKNCLNDLLDSIDVHNKTHGTNTKAVYVRGNHDKHGVTEHRNFKELNAKNPSVTFHDLTFVGDSDPATTSMFRPTTPKDPKVLEAAIAGQGDRIAKIACRITEETGKAPVTVAHRNQALRRTTKNGCTTLALSGHTHHRSKVRNIKATDGSVVHSFTAGTASGADMNIPVVDTIKIASSMTFMQIDRETGVLKSAVTAVINPNSTAEIYDEAVSSAGGV